MQKRVLEVLKTWYFPYSAFWSAGQWGGAITPPRTPTGYATGPRPRTALPRADPLEAKDRNARGQGPGQGKKRKCSQKIFFQKKFSGVLQKKTTSKIFFWRSTKFKQVKAKNNAVLEPRTGQFSRI